MSAHRLALWSFLRPISLLLVLPRPPLRLLLVRGPQQREWEHRRHHAEVVEETLKRDYLSDHPLPRSFAQYFFYDTRAQRRPFASAVVGKGGNSPNKRFCTVAFMGPDDKSAVPRCGTRGGKVMGNPCGVGDVFCGLQADAPVGVKGDMGERMWACRVIGRGHAVPNRADGPTVAGSAYGSELIKQIAIRKNDEN